LPPLIRAALAHVQFETIHPFLDGNGRLGRLLIALILAEARVMAEPVLFLSLFFKRHRADYYRLLQEVREQGSWESWIEFFLTGVAQTAEQAAETARQLTKLIEHDRAAIGELGRASASAGRIHELLQRRPLLTITAAVQALNLSSPTVGATLDRLAKLGIVSETTGGRRNRIFAYVRYLRLLEEGTEPLPPPAVDARRPAP
jgi:Fic family protein